MRRMDRYKEEDLNVTSSRKEKNEELYKEMNDNVKYANLTDVTDSNAYDITPENNQKKTRENYHKLKKYTDVNSEPKEKKELARVKKLYDENENKIYDINQVLEEARKNSLNVEEESKRKLKNTNYNILASLNKEELEKYRKEKEARSIKPTEEEVSGVIDTINTKTASGEMNKETSIDLLSDLLATQAIDRVEIEKEEKEEKIVESKYQTEKETVEKEITVEIEKPFTKNISEKEIEEVKEKAHKKKKESIMDKADTDFYTRSMDLSDKDFSMADDFTETESNGFIKFIIISILLALLVIGYIIYVKYK